MVKAIGIDLGTTNTVIAIARSGHSTPEPFTMRDGGNLERSAVIYHEGGWIAGSIAEDMCKMDPDCYIQSSKRFIGINFHDPRIQDDIQRMNTNNQRPRVIAPAQDEAAVRFCIYPRDRAPFYISPTEVATIILKQAKADAEEALGEPVTHAVITVPAYFDAAQIEATRQAGEAAGFIVQRIIEEPLAAAIAFGAQESGLQETVLVYDFGGGTFDVTLLEIHANHFRELAKGGNNHLGGDDFDQRLVNLVSKRVANSGLNLEASDTPTAVHWELRRQCRKAKESLSQLSSITIYKSVWSPHPRAAQCPLDAVEITRTEYEQIISDLVDETLKITKQVLAKSGKTVDKIDRVLLVGGSTFTPLVRERLRQLFGADKVKIGISPLLAVAFGAAHLALSLPRMQKCPKCHAEQDGSSTICETCGGVLPPVNHSLPQYVGSRPAITSTIAKTIGIATDEGAFVPVIRQGYPYSPTNSFQSPVQRHTFYIPANGVHGIRIPFYEGEASLATDPANHYLGELLIRDLPAGITQGEEVLVEVSVNGDRSLTGRAFVRSAVYPFRLDPDRFKGDLLDKINEARQLLDAVEDAETYARLETLTKRSESLLASQNIQPNQARLLKEELQREMEEALKEQREETAALDRLRWYLWDADLFISESSEWIELIPAVTDPLLHQQLTNESQLPAMLMPLIAQGRSAIMTGDEEKADKIAEKIFYALQLADILLTLAHFSLISKLPEDVWHNRPIVGLVTREELQRIREHGSSREGGHSPEATRQHCKELITTLLGQMRESITQSAVAFREHLEKGKLYETMYFATFN